MALRVLAGSTFKPTWISSGVTPSAIWFTLYNGSETLVDSITGTSSGNGHYYALSTLPDSIEGFYHGVWHATINSKPYKNSVKVQAIFNEVD